MEFQLVPALLAGLIAGVIMEGSVYMQKAMGLPVKQNIFRTWGQNLLGIRGGAGYVAGFGFHELIALVAAPLYALFFQAIGADGNLWLWGLVGGLIHYMIAGPVVMKIPSLDPETGAIGAQGFAYKNYGALDVVTSLMGHLIFGASTGILYALLHSMGGSTAAF